MQIPFYNNGIKDSFCDGYVTLEQFIENNIEPTEKQEELLDDITCASVDGDKKLKTKLKEKLLFFTPSIVIPLSKRRKYANIKEFTGLAQLDFDGLELQKAVEFKEYLFQHYQEIICAYLSPSKTGVKALIKIPISKNVEEYQAYYRAIEEEFEIYDGFDPAPKNAVLPLYLSHDVFLRERKDAKVWSIKKEVVKDLRETYPLPRKQYKPLKSNDKNKNRAINTVRKMINNIVASPGHFQLRSACLIFGTRVGSGYVDFYDALSEVENLVRANQYLSKGVDGYLTTAKWGVEEGVKTPKQY